MNMTMTCESAEKATEIKRFIKAANGNSTWDRLAEYLEKEVNGIEKFVINQTFEAPIELLFKLWTYPEHLQKWISPEGTEMKFIEAQIKEGGASFYTMFNKNFKLFGKSRYLKIKAPNFISYTQQFCDEAGKTSRHPLAPTGPETMMTTIAFAAESPELTRITVESEVSGKASKEETDTFLNSRAGMTMGWTGSFNKLEKYLSVAKNQSD
jgi:uncharacterized protein YndB with AHSA1/START domain